MLGVPKLKVELRENQRGRYLPIAEFLPDRCSYSLCIPEGKQSSGWTSFQTEIDDKVPPLSLTPPPTYLPKPHRDTFRDTSQSQNP